MRINIYSEEMTDRVEIISKEIDGHKFTGLRFYLYLPVTTADESGKPKQQRGPFIHRPDDDDSSAVTFWGKRDLREMLKMALDRLDKHYGDAQPRSDSGSARAMKLWRERVREEIIALVDEWSVENRQQYAFPANLANMIAEHITTPDERFHPALGSAGAPELREALAECVRWIADECQPEAEFVGQDHNWDMSHDERERGAAILKRARAALFQAAKEEEGK